MSFVSLIIISILMLCGALGAALLPRLVHAALSAVLAFVVFHLHLLADFVGSKGPDGYEWPIPYFYPFSREIELTWSGQWALNAWPNIVFTIALLAVTIYLAWRRGFSVLEVASSRADVGFVAALRRRFGEPAS